TTRKRLIRWPVKETEQLRDKKHHVTYSSKNLKGESLFEVSGITASQVDIEVSFMLPKLEEVEVLDPNWNDPQLLCSAKTATVGGRAGPFGLLVMASENLAEQTAIDHSVIESFGGEGRACITAEFTRDFSSIKKPISMLLTMEVLMLLFQS
ncbi:Concanavalin A-like lectin/glucanase superfamily, partial [Cynara cardunculus var. scolymus]